MAARANEQCPQTTVADKTFVSQLAHIEGTWSNELGSTVVFRSGTAPGHIEGEYQTGVARAEKLPPPTPLFGTVQRCDDGGLLVGFIVQWQVEREGKVRHSCCTWNGKLFPGAASFSTTWMLVSDVPQKDAWNSVTTNKDVFTRCSAAGAN